ncbi:MAG: hypothetical protein SGI96_04380 [Bacteroidota bacterium]|nr:hypothetical protein [Bacteroidota bacterium]
MQKIWETIKDYYITLGENYHVNPIIFLGIHIIATPLFILSVAWLIKNYRQKKSIMWPVIVSIFIFNAANIYLVIFGKNIPWWIYAILAATTIISSYFSYKKVRKKINAE